MGKSSNVHAIASNDISSVSHINCKANLNHPRSHPYRNQNWHSQLRCAKFGDGFNPEIRPGPWIRLSHPGPALKSFLYLRDPLFLVSCAFYTLNRWVLKPHIPSAFLRGQFNDLLLIPCALPPFLLLQRWLRLRAHDQPPAAREILFPLFIWTILFEWIGPRFVSGTTADPLDALAYGFGAIIAFAWWHSRSPSQPAA
jgi:hypothetical protein